MNDVEIKLTQDNQIAVIINGEVTILTIDEALAVRRELMTQIAEKKKEEETND